MNAQSRMELSNTHTWAWAGQSAPPWSTWPTLSCLYWWSTGSDHMVSHNPQWLEHSNSGRAQCQGSVGSTERERAREGFEVRRDDTEDRAGFLRIKQQGVVVTHRYCGSAVRAFMWNMPAGWCKRKCCWTRNTRWYTHTTEPKNRRVNAQPKTQPGSRTNLGSEICHNLTHYVAICISLSNVCVC